LTKFKNNHILPHKISHHFQVTARLFTGWKFPLQLPLQLQDHQCLSPHSTRQGISSSIWVYTDSESHRRHVTLPCAFLNPIGVQARELTLKAYAPSCSGIRQL